MAESQDPGLWGDPADRRDTTLAARAVRDRWPMSESVRVKVLKRLCRILDDQADHGALPPPGHREVIAAARALVAADKLNLDAEKFDHARAAAASDLTAEDATRQAAEVLRERRANRGPGGPPGGDGV